MQEDNKALNKKPTLYTFSVILFVLMSLCFVVFAIYIISLALLPVKYSVIMCAAFIIIITVVFIIFVRKRPEGKETHRKAKNIALIIISVLMTALLLFASRYIILFASSLNTINQKTSHSVLSVRVLKDSGYINTQSLKGVAIGINEGIDTDNTNYVIDELKKKMGDDLVIVSYKDYKSQIEALYDNEVGAVITNESILNTLNDLYEGFSDKTDIILSVKREITQQEISSKDLTKKAFNIYLSGGDNYGEIETNGRSDVNMIASINPLTKTVLLVNVPRDYYVALEGDDSKMDKLTHAGVYGIECSMNTVSYLLDTPIEYYVKVNFSSVAQIIDALGGINVYSPMTFILDDDDLSRYFYYEGYNEMSGKMAVRFCREREQMMQGDVDRGRNQENVIKAVIEKATSPAIITAFDNVLTAVTNNCITNIPTDSIMSLIQMQLSDMSGWNVSMYTLTGYDDAGYTYTGGYQELYIMDPDENTVAEAKLLLKHNMQMPDDKSIVIPDTPTLVEKQKKSE